MVEDALCIAYRTYRIYVHIYVHAICTHIADVWKSYTFEGKDYALSNNNIACLILCNK